MRNEFLLEIGTEEVPAWMIPQALESLRTLLEERLDAARLRKGAPVETFSTPRRLVAYCANLNPREPDSEKQVVGPPKAVAFDSTGKPTRAAESFASKQGVSIRQLKMIPTPKGDYVAAVTRTRGRTAREVLAGILPEIIPLISFPRSMYWTLADGGRSPRFIRPIRWLVALLGGRVVSLAVAGVRASNQTAGHRFLGREAIAVRTFNEYERKLARNGVILRASARSAKIQKEMAKLAAKHGLKVKEDSELLATVADLNEFPTAILGRFDAGYLALPEEVLVTVMRHHQKYFSLVDRRGKLQPCFIAIINLDRDPGPIRVGHERVLAARFNDARFFWDSDQKVPLANRLELLRTITYESRLGSYRDKIDRVKGLARTLLEMLPDGMRPDVTLGVRAVELSKCDLTTEMVREFTELEGIVGGLYARAQGEPEEVARAIYEHYRPRGLEDTAPKTLLGAIVSLADKMDSIASCFAAGLIPSGSSDPFALRRAGLGIVKVILEHRLPLNLDSVVAWVTTEVLAGINSEQGPEPLRREVLGFLEERARFFFKSVDGAAYDEVNAVFRAGWTDLVDARERLRALHAIRPTENFEPIAIAFKRIRNIVEKARPRESWAGGEVETDLLETGAEHALFDRAREVARRVEGLKRAHRYREALEQIASLRPTVDRYFDKVLVMTDDLARRQNRLRFLDWLAQEFSKIADFSEIVTTENRTRPERPT